MLYFVITIFNNVNIVKNVKLQLELAGALELSLELFLGLSLELFLGLSSELSCADPVLLPFS